MTTEKIGVHAIKKGDELVAIIYSDLATRQKVIMRVEPLSADEIAELIDGK